MAQFPFIGPAYQSRSVNFDAQRCVNMYLEGGNPASKSPSMLIGTPGLKLWANFAGGGVRGVERFSADIAIVVSGPNVYKVDSTGAGILIGTVDALTTVVSMASNGTMIMLVTGQNGYFIDPLLGKITRIDNPDFIGADTVWFLDGYFVFNKTGTGQFQITGLYNTEIDGLDFATAEGAPDLLLSLIADHRELWLFGETSTEVFFNSGNVDFPFERINGAFIEQGCAAKFSPAKMDNTVYWLTADERGTGTVQRAVGYQPQRVSTHALEYALSKMSRIDDAVGFTYQQEGHSFYQLNFPTAKQTWVFDAATNQWHERAWRNPVTAQLQQDRAICQMQFAGCTIVGDWENGNLYILDLNTYTHNGNPITRIRTCPHAAGPDYQWQFFWSFQVDMQTGVGINGVPGVPGVSPKARLRWSDDGGTSWSNELWVNVGELGNRRARAQWRRLGKSRDRVFEFAMTDPVPIVLIGASVKVTGGRS